jgi:hypothetical protein
MTPVCKRPDPRQAAGARAARATAPMPEDGAAAARALRAAQRRWRLKALACLRRKAR